MNQYPVPDEDTSGICYECGEPRALLIETDTQYVCTFCEQDFLKNSMWCEDLEESIDSWAELMQMERI